MTKKRELLLHEIHEAPESVVDELLSFVQQRKSEPHRRDLEVPLACAPVLEKDWLRPEEDEAWRDL
jgi:transcriptional regulator with AAA-type ATPase domain